MNNSTSHSETTSLVRRSLAKRYAAEKRFRAYGVFAIVACLTFLLVLLGSIISKGLPAFTQTYVKLDVDISADVLGISESPTAQELRSANYGALVKTTMRELFPEASSRKEKKALYELISTGAEYELYDRVAADPLLIGTTLSLWVPADDEMGAVIKNNDDLTDPDSIVTRPPSILRSSPRKTGGPTLSRSISIIWPPCRPLCLAC